MAAACSRDCRATETCSCTLRSNTCSVTSRLVCVTPSDVPSENTNKSDFFWRFQNSAHIETTIIHDLSFHCQSGWKGIESLVSPRFPSTTTVKGQQKMLLVSSSKFQFLISGQQDTFVVPEEKPPIQKKSVPVGDSAASSQTMSS